MAVCENPEEVLKRWNGSEWVTVACVKRMVVEGNNMEYKEVTNKKDSKGVLGGYFLDNAGYKTVEEVI